MVAVGLYYDAPNPYRVFSEFLAIPTTAGNVSTRTFFDFVRSVGPLVDFKGLRLVIQTAVGWNMVNLVRLASSVRMPRSRSTRLLFSKHL